MPEVKKLTTNIAPNDILFGDTSILIESLDSLDPKSAESGIVVSGVKGQVSLSSTGRVAKWSPEGALPPGRHMLQIEGLLDDKLGRIEQAMRVPFFVTDSRAKVPDTLRVETMTRLRVNRLGTERLPSDRRPSGKYVEIMKASDLKTGEPFELAFDESGGVVDAGSIFKQISENRQRKYGRLHETLYERLKGADPTTAIPVALWLRSEEALQPFEKSETEASDKQKKQTLARRAAIAKTIDEFLRAHQGLFVNKYRADIHAPVIYCVLTRGQIETLAKDPEVAGLFLHEPEGIEDLDTSMAISNADDVQEVMGFTGSGVRVAVWERGPDDTSDLSIEGRFLTEPNTSAHSRLTHAIIKNIERNKPHGYAPGCMLFSANDKDLDALSWATDDAGCTVISQSFHRPSEQTTGSLSFDDLFKDFLALQEPYPTFCQAAGNSSESTEFVNHKGFNGLTVGSHNDTATAMSPTSVSRNPPSDHGDRELPEIAANGMGVVAVGYNGDSGGSGTSMAAPAVAGAVALIQEVDRRLRRWPEGCRAILLAGARLNVVGGTWNQDRIAGVDALDGAGALDSLEAAEIAVRRRSRNGTTGKRRGWHTGTLRSSDIGSDRMWNFSFFVKVPDSGPRHVKVALAWDSQIVATPFSPPESKLTVDLDLHVFDSSGAPVARSLSFDNSYEIAEFDGEPGETFEIKIRRFSGSANVWFGVAWTVV